MAALTVKCAVYGALANGNENQSQAVDVSQALQAAIDANDGIVQINNTNMGGDPSAGNQKHFAAVVTLDDSDQYYACEENQTIDFFHTIPPSSPSSSA